MDFSDLPDAKEEDKKSFRKADGSINFDDLEGGTEETGEVPLPGPEFKEVDENAGGQFAPPRKKTVRAISEQDVASAKRGVDPFQKSPLTGDERHKVGFTTDRAKAIPFVRQQLVERFGEDVKVSLDPNTGNIVYKKPGSERWIEVNEEQGWEGMVGPGIVVGSELIGGVGGAILTKKPIVGPSVVGGIGAGVGEAIRGGLGEFYGVDEQDFTRSAETAVGSTLTGLVMGTAVKGLGKFWNVQPYTEAEIKGMQKELAEIGDYKGLEDSINARAGVKEDFDSISSSREGKFKLNTSQATGNKGLADLQETIQAGNKPGNIAIEKQARAQENINKSSLERYLDDITGERVNPATAADDIKGSQLDNSLQGARDSVESIEQASKKATTKFTEAAQNRSATPKQDLTDATRNALKIYYKKLKDIETNAWNKTNSLIGFNKNTQTSNFMLEVDDHLQTEVNRLQKRISQHIINAGHEEGGAITSTLKGLTDDVKDKVFDDPMLAKLVEIEEVISKPKIDIARINEAVKDINRLIRVSKNTGNMDAKAPALDELQDIKNALKSFRERKMEGQDEILEAIQDADNATIVKAGVFKRKFIDQILDDDYNKNFKLTSNKLFSRIFGSKDADAATDLAIALNGDPVAKQQFRSNFYAMYHHRVLKNNNGIPNPDAHATFMRENREVMENFFTTKELDQMETLGAFPAILSRYKDKLAKAEKTFKNTFNGKLSNINSERFVDEILKKKASKSDAGFSPNDVIKLNNMMKTLPKEFKESVNKGLRSEIYTRVKGKKGGIDVEALGKQLEDSDKLIPLLGAEYIRNLKVLYNAGKKASFKGSSVGTAQEAQALSITRVMFGPLSPIQRRLTAGRKFRMSQLDRAAYDALNDPEKLRVLIRNRHLDINSQKAAVILGNLATE